MTLRKFLGTLCIGLNILGLILKLVNLGFTAMLLPPNLILHILLFVVGGFWLSDDAGRNKRMIATLAVCLAAAYVAFSTLITLRTITPVAVINLFYLPLTIVLYVVVIREGKGSSK